MQKQTTAPIAKFIQDPDANLDYSLNWAPWLSDGETISTSTWASDSGLGIGTDSENEGVTTVWLSGGMLGRSYAVTNHIVTSEGRADDRTIEIGIRQR